MKNEVVAVKTEVVEALDSAVERGLAACQMAGRMSKALAVAGALQDLRAALSKEVMAAVMPLQGSALGFRTDKDKDGGYPEAVVKDCLIEASLSGVYPVGNEFNIIAGRAYITKEGMGRKLNSIPGLSWTVTPGIPENRNGGAIVPMAVEWSHGGKASAKELKVCVRVNSGMGADAIIGKATRKARAWLFQTVTGQEVPEGEAGDEPINVTPKASPFEVPEPAIQPEGGIEQFGLDGGDNVG